MSKPVIVIDFDDTLTAMPDFWREVIELARKHNHRIFCMTQRVEDDENMEIIDGWLNKNKIDIPVCYTNGESKIADLARLGFNKYILCDDNPKRAVNGV